MKTIRTILETLDGPVVAGPQKVSRRRDRFIEKLDATQRENRRELRWIQAGLALCVVSALVAVAETIMHPGAMATKIVLGGLLTFAAACMNRLIALSRELAQQNLLIVAAQGLGDEGLRELLDTLKKSLLTGPRHNLKTPGPQTTRGLEKPASTDEDREP